MSTPPEPSGQPEPWQKEARTLTSKILLGLSSKRSDEEWEHFKERTIQMFRAKGLFDHCNQQPNGKPDA
jgi:hypothetical protein